MAHRSPAPVLIRIKNTSGVKARLHYSYIPGQFHICRATLDTKQATLTTRASENIDGASGPISTVASSDYRPGPIARAHAFPGKLTDATKICAEEWLRSPRCFISWCSPRKTRWFLGSGFCGNAGHRVILPARANGRRWNAQSSCWKDRLRRQPGQLAIRQFRANVHPPRIQSG